MSEEEDKPTARDVIECLRHDLEITEDKEKYADMSIDDLRDCMANIIATLIFMFELMSGEDGLSEDKKASISSMFS